MPDNAEEPSHRLMREISATGPWAAKLASAARIDRENATFYYDLLTPQCAKVDIWRTTYHHALTGGPSAVVEWFKGTSLRPLLAPLDKTEQTAFLDTYEKEIAKAYPARPDGKVLLPFPRLFIVATV